MPSLRPASSAESGDDRRSVAARGDGARAPLGLPRSRDSYRRPPTSSGAAHGRSLSGAVGRFGRRQDCVAALSEAADSRRVRGGVRYLGEGAGTIHYGQLVLACGTNAHLNLVQGMANYALPLKTLGDGLFLRHRTELQPDVIHRRWLTTFIIVGGGFSGVETAGELTDFLYA